MITLFRSSIGEKDSTNTNVTNADIRQWIDEAQDWITSQNSPREFDTGYVVSASDAILSFTLPSRSESVYGVLGIDDTGAVKGPLMKVSIDSLGLVDRGKGTYAAFGSTIYVHTKYLLEDDTVRILFYGAPAYPAADTSTMALRQTQEPAVIEYCTYRLLTSRNFWGGAVSLKQAIKADLGSARKSRVITKATE